MATEKTHVEHFDGHLNRTIQLDELDLLRLRTAFENCAIKAIATEIGKELERRRYAHQSGSL